MNDIMLIEASQEYADRIREFRDAFPSGRSRVTHVEERIPGTDHLEEFDDVQSWLRFCRSMSGRVSWYMAVRKSDEKIVGFIVLRRNLEDDDDDFEFASHIGYSVRPDERRKGYAGQMLHLCLEKARAAGLECVRLVCLDSNAASRRTILSAGGVYIDTLHGEESGLNIDRFDIRLV